MENSFIQEFEILGLFGYKDVCIKFSHSILIVIGENGFGKTSILNALNFIITHSYKRLLDIKFNSIRVKIKNKDFFYERKLVEQYVSYTERKNEITSNTIIDLVKQYVDNDALLTAIEYVNNGNEDGFYKFVNNDDFLKTFPSNMLYQEFFTWNEQTKIFSKFQEMEQLIDDYDYTVLFYPTYRRVEADYNSLFPSDDRRRFIRHDEMREEQDLNIRFGMKDVAKRIDKITDAIRKSSLEGFTNVSGDMIHHMLDVNSTSEQTLKCSKDDLRIVLDRTGNRLKEGDKATILKQFDEKDDKLYKNNFLMFYLQQLLTIYRSQEKYDFAIKKFCEVCNRYINDKKFHYDASNVTLSIYRSIDEQLSISSDNIVELSQLSSGEKQIVSIFSQIYLELDKKFVVLFDEPELSLSIYWQENLLSDIISSGNCSFLMAVTHSPFIFGDKLKEYTVGIQEFIKR